MNLKSKSVKNDSKKGVTLRSRLLFTILPTVLLPLIIATGIDYKLSENRIKTTVLEELKANTLLASAEIDTFIRDSFVINNIVTANPDLIQSMEEGDKQAQKQKLSQQSIEDLEQKFATTKLLSTNSKLNNYLQEVVKSGQAAEIFYTDRNGYNIAFSNPTSDFVQRDEDWWQTSKTTGRHIGEAEFDESAKANVIAFSQAIKEPKTDRFLGVIKTAIHTTKLDRNLNTRLRRENALPTHYQIIDSNNGSLFFDVKNIEEEKGSARNKDRKGEAAEKAEVIGGLSIVEVAQTISKVTQNELNLSEAKQFITEQPGFSEVNLYQKSILSQASTIATFRYQGRVYGFSTVPNTNLVSIGIVDYEQVTALSRSLLITLATTTIVLGIITISSIVLLGQQLSKPLINLSATTNKVVKGDFDVTAAVEGTSETRTLANNFNQLVSQVKNSLEEQKTLANEQREEKEKLETAIYTLIEEVSDATDGDLTVRANLDSMELSTVADLFNAIIDNLQEIAVEARNSSNQVGSSLKQNEEVILVLAEHALSEAKETRNILTSVEQMSESIQTVAGNASQAEKIASDTYDTVIDSTSNMDLTVDSILALRTTVGETSKKMKRLGESSQKISQVVSFIEEIAIKTNVLAINATVEAGKAGEYGQGFTIVAEQVGALAEQSAAATKEIANIVAAIQAETKEVNQAMESGTTQVVETTRIVESTKQSLGLVLEKSQEIDRLMGSISQTTISQADTSQNLTELMHKISQMSETTSQASQRVAKSIVDVAEVAAKLESTVAQFKVSESA